jgi:hypothetical protein
MKQTKLAGLAIATTVAVAAFAGELQRIQVPVSKGASQIVVVMSGKEVIAEVKVRKPGILNLEAGDITWRAVPGKGNDYNCTGGSKLELVAEGKSVLTVSGDSMLIQSVDQNLKVKGPN